MEDEIGHSSTHSKEGGIHSKENMPKESAPKENMPKESAESAPKENAWLSTPQAAQKIGITTRTLYRLIDEGDLPAYRFGRVLRIKTVELDNFIESCRVEPGSLSTLYDKK